MNKKTGGSNLWLRIFLGLIVLAIIIFFLNLNAKNDLELTFVNENTPEPEPEAPIIENFDSNTYQACQSFIENNSGQLPQA
jgi:hypothetical protein